MNKISYILKLTSVRLPDGLRDGLAGGLEEAEKSSKNKKRGVITVTVLSLVAVLAAVLTVCALKAKKPSLTEQTDTDNVTSVVPDEEQGTQSVIRINSFASFYGSQLLLDTASSCYTASDGIIYVNTTDDRLFDSFGVTSEYYKSAVTTAFAYADSENVLPTYALYAKSSVLTVQESLALKALHTLNDKKINGELLQLIPCVASKGSFRYVLVLQLLLGNNLELTDLNGKKVGIYDADVAELDMEALAGVDATVYKTRIEMSVPVIYKEEHVRISFDTDADRSVSEHDGFFRIGSVKENGFNRLHHVGESVYVTEDGDAVYFTPADNSTDDGCETGTGGDIHTFHIKPPSIDIQTRAGVCDIINKTEIEWFFPLFTLDNADDAGSQGYIGYALYSQYRQKNGVMPASPQYFPKYDGTYVNLTGGRAVIQAYYDPMTQDRPYFDGTFLLYSPVYVTADPQTSQYNVREISVEQAASLLAQADTPVIDCTDKGALYEIAFPGFYDVLSTEVKDAEPVSLEFMLMSRMAPDAFDIKGYKGFDRDAYPLCKRPWSLTDKATDQPIVLTVYSENPVEYIERLDINYQVLTALSTYRGAAYDINGVICGIDAGGVIYLSNTSASYSRDVVILSDTDGNVIRVAPDIGSTVGWTDYFSWQQLSPGICAGTIAYLVYDYENTPGNRVVVTDIRVTEDPGVIFDYIVFGSYYYPLRSGDPVIPYMIFDAAGNVRKFGDTYDAVIYASQPSYVFSAAVSIVNDDVEGLTYTIEYLN